jgi:hypothetical protein
MTHGYYYGLPETNAGVHSYGGSSSILSCLPELTVRVPQNFGLNILRRFNQSMWRGGNEGGLYVTPRGSFFMQVTLVATS